MNRKNVIVESLDYRELIKKYNGKPYTDQNGKKNETGNEEYAGENKLWYFDPPYHPAALYGGREAPYMSTFDIDMVHEMTGILHNDREEEFGRLDYFIKSDYNPKYRYDEENMHRKLNDEEMKELENAYHDFDVLEENDRDSKAHKGEKAVYYVECLGDFNKGTLDGTGEKSVGREYIWCRGNYQGKELKGGKYCADEGLQEGLQEDSGTKEQAE